MKKRVNFDDPQTYNFYYWDEVGSSGSILTFFPGTRVKEGKPGAGMATEIGYSVSASCLESWQQQQSSASHLLKGTAGKNRKRLT